MNQVVYVVTWEPYHDNSEVRGVYVSLKVAKDSFGHLEWADEGYYVTHWPDVVSQASDVLATWLIREMEVRL